MPEISRELITEAEMWAPAIVKICAAFAEDPERGLRMKHSMLAEIVGAPIEVLKRTMKTPLFRQLFAKRMSQITDREKPTIDLLYRELAEAALLGAFKLRNILETSKDEKLVAKVAVDVIDRATMPTRAPDASRPFIGEMNILTMNLTPEKREKVIDVAHELLVSVSAGDGDVKETTTDDE